MTHKEIIDSKIGEIDTQLHRLPPDDAGRREGISALCWVRAVLLGSVMLPSRELADRAE